MNNLPVGAFNLPPGCSLNDIDPAEKAYECKKCAQIFPEDELDKGYCEECYDERNELKEAFDLVKNPVHWKDPIDSVCTTDEVKIIAEAIEYFTATKASFDYLGIVMAREQGRFKAGDHLMKVRADGYRKGPAGDH